MTALANAFIILSLTGAAALMLLSWVRVIKWGVEEAERTRLRASTAAAMRTDRHLARLRKQKMRVQYMRRARVW